ncbi:MAG: enoyl-CoA hydratase [Alphaproteobacteria bacterium]|nr:enoyl-CoA hydratase [Alphaproteobacteria bacterium]
MRTDFATLTLATVEPGLLLLTLNRPEVRNALNTRMGEELREIFVPLKFTPGDLRVIVITGAGDKAFSAGGDLKERKGMADDTWRLQHAIFEEAYWAVMECSVPVIAAVQGHAYAGGCELALACDFIYAAATANFALTEVSIGIMPGGGGTQNLPRAVGERRAKELILTGRPWSAAEALAWGMVNAVLPPAELMPAVLATARRIRDSAPISVRQAKKAIHHGLQTDLMTGLHFEVQAYERMISTADRREGILAFNEKRKPRFEGR